MTDATTAHIIVQVLNTSEIDGEKTMGEVELSLAGILAAEIAVAEARAASNGVIVESEIQGEGKCDKDVSIGRSPAKNDASGRRDSKKSRLAKRSASSDQQRLNREPEFQPRQKSSRVKGIRPWDVKPRGIESWFPLYLPSKTGGNRERESAGEVRLSFRFLSTDFMLQRQLTAGADEGDNGPIGSLRYVLERRPGRMLINIRCCRALPKAMIGDRAPLVEARLVPGEWACSTRRQAGLDPTFNEIMTAELLWTPPEFQSPELLLEVKDKALGGGRMALIRVPVVPFVLHPRMHADVWYPLSTCGRGDQNSGIFCDMVYVPSEDALQPGNRKDITETPSGESRPLMDSFNSSAYPLKQPARSQSHNGVMHVEIISARGLPACAKDPQIGVRLRVYDHRGSSLPPFQRTPVVRGARGEVRFDKTFLLYLKHGPPANGDLATQNTLGSTPVLEIELRCARGKGRRLGTVEIPLFALWFMGHMTRTWYPMRVADGKGEAGSVFAGLQFLADESVEGTTDAVETGPSASNPRAATERRRFLFIEVRQGRGLCRTHSFSGQDPAAHVELLGSGASAKTASVRDGGTDPEWRDGAGILTLPYRSHTTVVTEHDGKRNSEVLRITAINERGLDSGQAASHLGIVGGNDRILGQCDWPLPVEELDEGRPICTWHALWMGGNPSGELYIRCRVGFEGEALDHFQSRGVLSVSEGNSGTPLHSIGNYHVEFLDVRGFERMVRSRQLTAASAPASGAPHGIPWKGKSFLAAAPAAAEDVDAAHGAPYVRVASGRAVAVRTTGRDSSQYLCVKLSTHHHEYGDVVATSSVSPEKLQRLTGVPGSELHEWLPMVAMLSGGKGTQRGAGGADTGQLLISVRYFPLAVGVLEVSVLETVLTGSVETGDSARPYIPTASGNFQALTRLLPADTGGSMGHRVRRTPTRRGFQTSSRKKATYQQSMEDTTVRCSWADAQPHRMRFNNAFNGRPTALHVSVVQGESTIGYATVLTEEIVHDVIASMSRDIDEGRRRPRCSAYDLGAIGTIDDDFGDSRDAWYSLKKPSVLTSRTGRIGSVLVGEPDSDMTPIEGESIGRIRISVRFAPHPKVLIPSWQEEAAVRRARGIMAMKALFYRVNHSGGLVVEKEDLRVELLRASEAFLNESPKAMHNAQRTTVTNMTAWRGVGGEGGGGSAQAGGFVLQVMRVLEAGKLSRSDLASPHVGIDAIFSAMDRDRNGEVSFTEYCTFLLRAAARQAEVEVRELLNDLSEDNDDDHDDDSGDDLVHELHPRRSDVKAKTRDVDQDEEPSSPEEPILFGDGQSSSTYISPREIPLHSLRSETAAECTGPQSTAVGNNERIQHPEISDPIPQQRLTASPGPERRARSPDKAQGGVRGTTRLASERHEKEGGTKANMSESVSQRKTTERLKKGITSWMVADVITWLSERLQLPQYVQVFREASVDGLLLTELSGELLTEMGVSNPLHRLKLLRHVQELRKQAGMRDSKSGAGSHSVKTQNHRMIDFVLPRQTNAHIVDHIRVSREDTTVGIQGNGPRETLEQRSVLPTEFASRSDRRGTVQRVDVSTENVGGGPQTRRRQGGNEGEFVQAMGEVLSEFTREVREKSSRTRAPSGLPQECTKKIPANATTAEVLDVVKNAMWEVADNLEEQQQGGNTSGDSNPRELSRGNFPETWWGSSDDDSGSVNRETREPSSKPSPRYMDDLRERPGVRLLFDEFVKINTEKVRSKRLRGGSVSRLTRPKLQGGIRSLLGIEMKWEQSNQVLNSLADLRSKGHLSLSDFARAFAFPPPVAVDLATVSSRGQLSPRREDGSTWVSTDSLGESRQSGMGMSPRSPPECPLVGVSPPREGTPSQQLDTLRDCVLGMAETLQELELTLQDVVAKYDRHSSGKVRAVRATTAVSDCRRCRVMGEAELCLTLRYGGPRSGCCSLTARKSIHCV